MRRADRPGIRLNESNSILLKAKLKEHSMKFRILVLFAALLGAVPAFAHEVEKALTVDGSLTPARITSNWLRKTSRSMCWSWIQKSSPQRQPGSKALRSFSSMGSNSAFLWKQAHPAV
jgi:hypothetical protein